MASLITFPAGTRVRQPMACVDAQGAVLNLTGVTPISMRIFSEATTHLTASLANSRLTVTNASSGLIRLDLEMADTSALAGEYQYEVWATISGVSQLIGRGNLHITQTHGDV